MTRAHCFWIVLVVLACVFEALGQAPGGNGPTPSQVVSIPVTVTTRSGAPVTGLNAASFSLSAGSENQALESAREIAPVTVGPRKDKVPFIVLDAVGSPSSVQGEIRKECLQVLADAAANGTPISLSQIDHDGLHVIHEIGTPASILISALLQLDNEDHFLNHRDHLTAMQTAPEDKSLLAAETDRLRRFRRGTIEHANMMRTLLIQLEAFQKMAGALQRAQGRKTVIWLTGYFPIEVNEVENSINIDSYGIESGFHVKSASVDYQMTVNQLNYAHISIFPVQLAGEMHTHIGLWRIAQSTGGEVISYSKALEELIKYAEDRSTSYYLLAFQPKVTTGLKWTKLKVQLNDQSLKVTSANGLFVFPPPK